MWVAPSRYASKARQPGRLPGLTMQHLEQIHTTHSYSNTCARRQMPAHRVCSSWAQPNNNATESTKDLIMETVDGTPSTQKPDTQH